MNRRAKTEINLTPWSRLVDAGFPPLRDTPNQVFLLLLALLLSACNLATEPVPAGPVQSGPQPVTDAAPAAIPDAAAGQQIYEARCAACHGPQGAGDGEQAEQIAEQGGNLPNLRDLDLVRSRDPLTWYQITTNGNIGNLMPPWAEALTDSERWNVTYYLYTFARPEGALERGRALYEERFAAEYDGEDPGFDDPARMVGLSLDEIREQFVTDNSLTEEEALAVAWYILSFGPATTPIEAEEPPDDDVEDAPAGLPLGEVRGSVQNASGGAVPEGIEVEITGVEVREEGLNEFLVRRAPVSADGSFSFEELPFEPESTAYVVATVYEGVEFTNGAILEAGQSALDLPLTIYETTTDPTALTVERMSFAVQPGPATLEVVQVIQVRNRTDRVYVTEEPVVGGRRGTFAIRVPVDAVDIQIQQGQIGGRFVPGDVNAIYDTVPVPPGGEQQTLAVSYTLPFEGVREVAIPLDYPVEQVALLIEDSLQLRAEGFTDGGAQVVGGVPYEQYFGVGYTPGGTLLFRVGTGGLNTDVLPLVLSVALVILVIAGVAYGFVARRPPDWELDASAEALLTEIAELDARFEAGKVDRFTYEEQRAALKADLAEALGRG